MFDSVYIKCPHCGEGNEFQSKAGDCMLNVYGPEDCPGQILHDCFSNGMICKCDHCKKKYQILFQYFTKLDAVKL